MTEYWNIKDMLPSFDERQVATECGWLLGRVCARLEQVCRTILPPTFADELRGEVRIRGIAALATLAGNTLGETALRQLLSGELAVPPSREYLRQELINQIAAVDALAGRARLSATDAHSPLTTSTLLALHTALLRDLQPLGMHGMAPPGALRREERLFQGIPGAPPAEIAPQLEGLAAWLAERHDPLRDAFDDFGSGLLRALLAHRCLLWIRPFALANGRVARLVEQQLLRRTRLPAIVTLLLPIHYQLTHSAYTAQLAAQPTEESLFAFIGYALEGLLDGLDELLDRMAESHLSVHWLRHVSLTIGDSERTTTERKSLIMASISTQDSPIKRDKIPQLSPRLAAVYSQLTDRTLRRDLQDLLRLGLLEESAVGLRARKEQLYAFLPGWA